MSKNKSELKEIRVYGVKPQLHQDLMNISENLGVDASSLLKPKIQEFVDSFPPDKKKLRLD